MPLKSEDPIIVWFRNDLRVSDNPALAEASKRAKVVPIYIHDPQDGSSFPLGAASKWWLHNSLDALSHRLKKLGCPLLLRKGKTKDILLGLAKETGAKVVHWNTRYLHHEVDMDSDISGKLEALGIEVCSYPGFLLSEPWEIHNQSGFAFKVFTPFWKHCLEKLNPATPLPAPIAVESMENPPQSQAIEDLGLFPKIEWYGGMDEFWNPGESGAQANLASFIADIFRAYSSSRDIPGTRGTSRLSPHLHFGEISPRQIWHALKGTGIIGWKNSQFLAEVGWREFAYHLLHAFPETTCHPLRPEFQHFPWEPDDRLLHAWQKGMTGYPLVDAGMRELWATGWMHNRVRMVVASFLIKHLLQDWREGAKWFWDTLVDADLASNTLGWQWTAGCGADAAPFFRIFNPTSQAQKFDPRGTYIHKWIPELRSLKPPALFEPWKVPPLELGMAGIELGKTYPVPVVNHPEARQKALDAYEATKGK